MPTGLALAMGVGRVPARPSPYAVETRRVLDRWQALGVGASDERAAVLDVFVRALKGSTAWAKLPGYWLMAAHAELAALVNIVSPGTKDLVRGGVAYPTFSADRGLTGTGSGRLDTGIDPTTIGGGIGQDSFSAGVRSLTAGQSDAFAIGTEAGGGNIWLRPRSTGDAFAARVVDDGSPSLTAANTDGTGHYAMVRSAAGARLIYKDGTQVGTDSEASTAPAASQISFLRRGSTYSTREIASGFVASGLTAQEIADLVAADLAYMQAIGAVA